MEKLIEQARGQFEIASVGIVHRLGKLAVGETSVVISVAARTAATPLKRANG
jgi:molybdopterin synthase catalytic subunit